MTVAYFDSSALAKAAWDTFRQALRLVEVTPQLEEDAADEHSLALDHGVDEPLPVDDVEMWACGVRTWLTEQLDTGVLRWGRRITLPDGTTAIDPSIHPGPASPWWVSPVPLVRPTPPGQRQLRRAARSRRGGGVVTLGGSIEFQPDPAPGGQLIVAWREGSETVVQLEQLEYRPSTPRAAIEELVLAGLHAAADAGARVIEHGLDEPGPPPVRVALEAPGRRPTPERHGHPVTTQVPRRAAITGLAPGSLAPSAPEWSRIGRHDHGAAPPLQGGDVRDDRTCSPRPVDGRTPAAARRMSAPVRWIPRFLTAPGRWAGRQGSSW